MFCAPHQTMEQRTLTLSNLDRGVDSAHALRLLAFLLRQKQEDQANGRPTRSWGLGDPIIVDVRERGKFQFRPVVTLVNDNTIRIVGQDPTEVKRSGIENVPRYVAPCWGFCGPNQAIRTPEVLADIDIGDCDFTPFTAENALISEQSAQQGQQSWSYTVGREKYTVEQSNLPGVYYQYSANRQRVRQVLRLTMHDAKRVVIQSDLLATLPESLVVVFTPLFHAENFKEPGAPCKVSFPVALYDTMRRQGKYIVRDPSKYDNMDRQRAVLEEEYQLLTMAEALYILNYIPDTRDPRYYPFTQAVMVQL